VIAIGADTLPFVPQRKPNSLGPDFRFEASASSNPASTGLGGCPSSAHIATFVRVLAIHPPA
jgi:hypothetical protein